MKLDDIFTEWAKDSNIDQSRLDEESLKIPKLHHKYYEIYMHEKLLLRKYEADLKTLKFDKTEFYQNGPDEESEKKGWKLPAKGKIYKPDVPSYVEVDQEIIDLTLKIGLQKEKTDLLSSIIDSINRRGFSIKNAIDFIKWQSGS